MKGRKGSSDSDEDKKSINNKHKNHEKIKKHKREQDKISPKKDSNKIIKKKYHSRKNTGNDFFIRKPKNIHWRICPALYSLPDIHTIRTGDA